MPWLVMFLRLCCGAGHNQRRRDIAFGLGLAAFALYAWVQLRVFWETSVMIPRYRRVPRELKEIRLPALYLCPADREQANALRWHSFDCTLSFRSQRRNCSAFVRQYRGEAPDVFKGAPGGRGGECIEFGTHAVDVVREYSASWNEIILRASFSLETGPSMTDALREVELGYLEEEWRPGMRKDTLDRFYYPLLRLPFYNLGSGPGAATRTFLAEEMQRDLHGVDRYWYAYGTTQLQVENPSLPTGGIFPLAGPPLHQESLAPSTTAPHGLVPGWSGAGGVGVAHAILTLEDFTEFVYDREAPIIPFLSVCGEIAGVASVVAWLLHAASAEGRRKREVHPSEDEGRRPDRLPQDRNGGAGCSYSHLSTDETLPSGLMADVEDGEAGL